MQTSSNAIFIVNLCEQVSTDDDGDCCKRSVLPGSYLDTATRIIHLISYLFEP